MPIDDDVNERLGSYYDNIGLFFGKTLLFAGGCATLTNFALKRARPNLGIDTRLALSSIPFVGSTVYCLESQDPIVFHPVKLTKGIFRYSTLFKSTLYPNSDPDYSPHTFDETYVIDSSGRRVELGNFTVKKSDNYHAGHYKYRTLETITTNKQIDKTTRFDVKWDPIGHSFLLMGTGGENGVISLSVFARNQFHFSNGTIPSNKFKSVCEMNYIILGGHKFEIEDFQNKFEGGYYQTGYVNMIVRDEWSRLFSNKFNISFNANGEYETRSVQPRLPLEFKPKPEKENEKNDNRLKAEYPTTGAIRRIVNWGNYGNFARVGNLVAGFARIFGVYADGSSFWSNKPTFHTIRSDRDYVDSGTQLSIAPEVATKMSENTKFQSIYDIECVSPVVCDDSYIRNMSDPFTPNVGVLVVGERMSEVHLLKSTLDGYLRFIKVGNKKPKNNNRKDKATLLADGDLLAVACNNEVNLYETRLGYKISTIKKRASEIAHIRCINTRRSRPYDHLSNNLFTTTMMIALKNGNIEMIEIEHRN